MAEITRVTVQKIAALANLNLGEDDATRFAKQLEHILDYVHKLSQLDTKGVPQTAHALPLQNVWRDDVVKPCLDRDEVLAAAPDPQDGCFRVPRIIE
jgi:aspartyl-tRNA(Asn)/glutamyl-tRNA(Gln) amidotransferase subunit C